MSKNTHAGQLLIIAVQALKEYADTRKVTSTELARKTLKDIADNLRPEGVCLTPWSEDQVNSINSYQVSGRHHPFTGSEDPEGNRSDLIATKEGWVEYVGGPIIQTWSYPHMADWSWRH